MKKNVKIWLIDHLNGQSVLKTKVVEKEKKKEYEFSIVQDWVKYPIKDPTKYMKVNWKPCVDFIKSKQRITK